MSEEIDVYLPMDRDGYPSSKTDGTVDQELFRKEVRLMCGCDCWSPVYGEYLLSMAGVVALCGIFLSSLFVGSCPPFGRAIPVTESSCPSQDVGGHDWCRNVSNALCANQFTARHAYLCLNASVVLVTCSTIIWCLFGILHICSLGWREPDERLKPMMWSIPINIGMAFGTYLVGHYRDPKSMWHGMGAGLIFTLPAIRNLILAWQRCQSLSALQQRNPKRYNHDAWKKTRSEGNPYFWFSIVASISAVCLFTIQNVLNDDNSDNVVAVWSEWIGLLLAATETILVPWTFRYHRESLGGGYRS